MLGILFVCLLISSQIKYKEKIACKNSDTQNFTTVCIELISYIPFYDCSSNISIYIYIHIYIYIYIYIYTHIYIYINLKRYSKLF